MTKKFYDSTLLRNPQSKNSLKIFLKKFLIFERKCELYYFLKKYYDDRIY